MKNLFNVFKENKLLVAFSDYISFQLHSASSVKAVFMNAHTKYLKINYFGLYYNESLSTYVAQFDGSWSVCSTLIKFAMGRIAFSELQNHELVGVFDFMLAMQCGCWKSGYPNWYRFHLTHIRLSGQ